MTRASLFTYPCLMAADILLYGTDRVPVGGDQDQHVELARDIAIRFNREYGETFVVPQLQKAALATRIKDLQNPTAKMSKSDEDNAVGTIRLLDPPDVIRRQIMRAVTDSEARCATTSRRNLASPICWRSWPPAPTAIRSSWQRAIRRTAS